MAQASQAALLTNVDSKRTALTNAVTNVAMHALDIDADLQAILPRLVGDMTPSHLRLLDILEDPYRTLPGGWAGDAAERESQRTPSGAKRGDTVVAPPPTRASRVGRRPTPF